MKTFVILVRNILFIVGFLLILATQFAQAQTSQAFEKLHDLSYSLSAKQKILALKFVSDQPVQNLLVMVLDANGTTLFLENKYRFTGDYQREIDLRDQPAGDYTLNIISDQEKIKRPIHLD